MRQVDPQIPNPNRSTILHEFPRVQHLVTLAIGVEIARILDCFDALVSNILSIDTVPVIRLALDLYRKAKFRTPVFPIRVSERIRTTVESLVEKFPRVEDLQSEVLPAN
jgi:hypothetical protein